MFLSTVASFIPGDPGGDVCSLMVSSRLDGAYPESLLPLGSGLMCLFGVLLLEDEIEFDYKVFRLERFLMKDSKETKFRTKRKPMAP